MNILHLTPHLSIRGGGLATAALGLAEVQSRLHHFVRVASTEEAPPPAAEGYGVLTFPFTGPEALIYSPAAEQWAQSEAAADFDILHQHGIWHMFSRVTTRWRRSHHKPTLVAPHGSLESWALRKSPFKKRAALVGYESNNLHNATCIQATTPEEVTGIRAFGLRNPIALIPNGVSEEWLAIPGSAERFRAAHGIAEDRRLMLFMSRLHPKKGLIDLVEAFVAAQPDLKDWDLVLAGPEVDTKYAVIVRRVLAEHGLSGRVFFTGTLGPVEKRDALEASEVFVLPTHSDNFAIVIAEALGTGVPVIATEGAIAWRSLEEENCGWWIPNGGSHLVGKLREVAALPPCALAEMGARGEQLVRRKFLWSHAAERSIEVYQWMVGGSARPDCIIY